MNNKILSLVLCLIASTFFNSCSLSEEERYIKKQWELKRKNEELDYLKRLYSMKNEILIEQKIKTLDSLINDEIKTTSDN